VIVGETVVVERRQVTGEDRLGEPTYEWVSETVEDVLVAPGPRTDLMGARSSDAFRADGLRVEWNLHFPKGYPPTLKGARISVRGGPLMNVVGDPQHYTTANTPGRWSMPVEVWQVEG